jgi:sortase A
VTKRRRISAAGILGELLVTAGLLVLFFIVWQLTIENALVGGAESATAATLSKQWVAAANSRASVKPTRPVTPVVMAAPANLQKFGVLIVPRWGSNFERPIAQGAGQDVLDTVGVGHYSGTQMPGQVGNFAIASHRSAYGGAFHTLQNLRPGDQIYVETKDGWYSYAFRNTVYVRSSQVGVIQPVPMEPGVSPTDRLITLTTCNPLWSSAERFVAFGVFDGWYPIADGPPPGLRG